MPPEWIGNIVGRLVKRVLASGRAAEEDVDEVVWEEVFGGEEPTESAWKWLWHRDIPEVLKEALEKAGLTCTLYYKREEVPGYEYLASCITRGGREVTVGFNLSYDHEADELTLLDVEVMPRKPPAGLLAYYTQV